VPDVAVAQGQRQSTQSTVALATVSRPSDAVTVTLTIPETIRQGYLEIREIATSQVITVVEVLSPTNKRPGRGRMEYETKRATLLGSLCNFVEIDLLRQWPPLVIPQGIEPSAYRILVSPQELRPQASWYGFNLADPIPLFELPLQSGDQIPVVDLKGLLDGIYDRSGYGLVIDYAHNGLQCVMFTHQDTGVWADMVSIFWAAGLQVVSAWYIDTETSSELRQGAYVQGTVTMLLRKRLRTVSTFKQRLLPLIRKEVTAQIEAMMNLNDTAQVHGETVFNDSPSEPHAVPIHAIIPFREAIPIRAHTRIGSSSSSSLTSSASSLIGSVSSSFVVVDSRFRRRMRFFLAALMTFFVLSVLLFLFFLCD
jgi:hypothetical protein